MDVLKGWRALWGAMLFAFFRVGGPCRIQKKGYLDRHSEEKGLRIRMAQIIELLKCISCGSTSFVDEIGQGFSSVHCTKCQYVYPLHFGIPVVSQRGKINGVDYRLPSWREEERKKEKQLELDYNLSDEYLFQLPFPQNRTDTTFQFKSGAMGQNFLEVIDRVGIRASDFVLDLAAGSAWTSYLLVQRGCNTIATDQRTIKYWGLRSVLTYQNRYGKNIQALCCDFSPIPLQDSIFDVVVCNNAFQYAPDIIAALNEIKRVLRPGGRLVLSWTGTRGWLKSRKWGPGYTLRSNFHAVTRSGFLVEAVYPPRHLIDSVLSSEQHHVVIARIARAMKVASNSGLAVKILNSWLYTSMGQVMGLPFNLIAKNAR